MSEFEAGPELDALVIEKVMGRTICEHSRIRGVAQSGGYAMCGDQECKGELHYKFLPNYSTDVQEAWKVVLKLIELHFTSFHISAYQDSSTFKIWEPARETIAHGKTLSLAICRAAVSATLARRRDP